MSPQTQNDNPDVILMSKHYKVLVHNLILPWSIGVYAHERKQLQRVRISVSLKTEWDPARLNDNIDDVLSYADVVDGIKSLARNEGHINLVETLSMRIGELCLKDLRVLSACVRVEKLDIYDTIESVGVEAEYSRK